MQEERAASTALYTGVGKWGHTSGCTITQGLTPVRAKPNTAIAAFSVLGSAGGDSSQGKDHIIPILHLLHEPPSQLRTAFTTETERSQTPPCSHHKAASPQSAVCCWTGVKYSVVCPHEHVAISLHGQESSQCPLLAKSAWETLLAKSWKKESLSLLFPTHIGGWAKLNTKCLQAVSARFLYNSSDPHSKLEVSCLLEPGWIPSNCLTADWGQHEYVEQASMMKQSNERYLHLHYKQN